MKTKEEEEKNRHTHPDNRPIARNREPEDPDPVMDRVDPLNDDPMERLRAGVCITVS